MRHPTRSILATLMGVTLALVVTTSAHATDGIYWTNFASPYGVYYTSAAGGSNLDTRGYTFRSGPQGLAFDPAAGRAYWTNPVQDTIGYAEIDGGASGDLPTPGVALDHPAGLSIDAAAGRLYIANTARNRITWVKTDGTGGGDLDTTGATVDGPYGIAVDAAAGRVYWSNNTGGSISWARLDGTGGGNVNPGPAPVAAPLGVAVDPAAGRVYWASYGAGTIGWASTTGSGAGVLDTTGATAGGPSGLAIDAGAGKLYFGNISANRLSSAALDGSGGADVATPQDLLKTPFALALLQDPRNSEPPQITGAGAVGSTLTCSPGAWAPDVAAAFLFRAPHTLGYAWQRNGSFIPRASASTLTTSQAGEYTCLVKATNNAGSLQVASEPASVGGPADPNPPGQVTVEIQRITTNSRGGSLSVWASVPGRVTITAGDKIEAIGDKPIRAGDPARRILFKLSSSARGTLSQNGRLSIIFTARFTASGSGRTALTQKSTLISQ
jgi:DNA-binding beta-propeller fold protein YncE